MSIEVTITAAELRSALKEIEAAEKNGFHHCLSVFRLASVGRCISDCTAVHARGEMIERAHPTNPSLDWGRGQGVTSRLRFVNGDLVPVRSKP